MNVFKKLSVVGCFISLALAVVTMVVALSQVDSGDKFRLNEQIDRITEVQELVGDYRVLVLQITYEEVEPGHVMENLSYTSQRLESFVIRYENNQDQVIAGFIAQLQNVLDRQVAFVAEYELDSESIKFSLIDSCDEALSYLRGLVEYDTVTADSEIWQEGNAGIQGKIIVAILFSMLIIVLVFTTIMAILAKPQKPRVELHSGMTY